MVMLYSSVIKRFVKKRLGKICRGKKSSSFKVVSPIQNDSIHQDNVQAVVLPQDVTEESVVSASDNTSEQQLTPAIADSVDQVGSSGSSSTSSNSSAPREIKGSDAIQKAERSEVTKEAKSSEVLDIPKETPMNWTPPEIDNTPFDHLWKNAVCERYFVSHRILFKFNHPLFNGKPFLGNPLKLKDSEAEETYQTSKGFDERVVREKVLLEYCRIEDSNTLSGFVRVANLTYHKKVFVLYTYDNWSSTEKAMATYRKSFGNYESDQFQFEIQLKKDFSSMEFILSFESDGCGMFWDKNNGKTYVVKNEKAITKKMYYQKPLSVCRKELKV